MQIGPIRHQQNGSFTVKVNEETRDQVRLTLWIPVANHGIPASDVLSMGLWKAGLGLASSGKGMSFSFDPTGHPKNQETRGLSGGERFLLSGWRKVEQKVQVQPER